MDTPLGVGVPSVGVVLVSDGANIVGSMFDERGSGRAFRVLPDPSVVGGVSIIDYAHTSTTVECDTVPYDGHLDSGQSAAEALADWDALQPQQMQQQFEFVETFIDVGFIWSSGALTASPALTTAFGSGLGEVLSAFLVNEADLGALLAFFFDGTLQDVVLYRVREVRAPGVSDLDVLLASPNPTFSSLGFLRGFRDLAFDLDFFPDLPVDLWVGISFLKTQTARGRAELPRSTSGFPLSGTSMNNVFAWVQFETAFKDLTLAHELGHLNGMEHNTRVASSVPYRPFAHGAWNFGKGRTVMTRYEGDFGDWADCGFPFPDVTNCTRFPFYSSPNFFAGSVTTEHNARVFVVNSGVIATYR